MKTAYRLLTIFFITTFLSLNVSAQKRSIVEISNSNASIKGDFLTVSFKIKGDDKKAVISSTEALQIVPVYSEGTHRIDFPKILINGKRRAAFYKREQNLLSQEAYLKGKPYKVITLKKGDILEVDYNYTLQLPANLNKNGEVEIVQLLQDCCDTLQLASQTVDVDIAGKALSPFLPTEAHLAFIEPKEERIKSRNEQLSLYINYVLDQDVVLRDYKDNARELKRLDDLIKVLDSGDNTYQITAASIEGFASPEGTYQHNLDLSQRRANSMKMYVKNYYPLLSEVAISAKGMGENWDGLKREIAQSSKSYRNEVLSIIDNVKVFDGREKELMELQDGKPYREMLRDIFPRLRRMEMQIAYKVRAFTIDEVAAFYKTRPQDLSQKEIYTVAQRQNKEIDLTKNRSQYGMEYDTAAKYFPNDSVALLNASSAALIRNEKDKAWAYLQKIKHLPEAKNNIGVYFWMTGELEKAESAFKEAIQAGDKKATLNLEKLNQYRGR